MVEAPEHGIEFEGSAAQGTQPDARVLRRTQCLVQGERRRPGGCFPAVDGVDDALAGATAAAQLLQDPAGAPARP